MAWYGYAVDDPFADLQVSAPAAALAEERVASGSFWRDNLLLRRELYLLFGAGEDTLSREHGIMSRSSAGFEVQKRFSTATRTVAMADYQGRMVYRNRWLESTSDTMGRGENAWKYETHNAYLDLYNVVGEPGRVNLRLGHFYQPFGLGYQTDTHGTLLQLSNDALFGVNHDWQTTLYGALNESLDYAAGYLFGAGHDNKLAGQSGMVVARVMLNNEWLFQHGLEGGVSFAAGERVDMHGAMRSPAVHAAARGGEVVKTWRGGADIRKRIDSVGGPFTLTAETALGEDKSDLLASNLAQADWLHPGRRWGSALQFRHFWQDTGTGIESINESRAIGVITHYFRNEVGNANLHWVALAVERAMRRLDSHNDTMIMLQYYRYW